MASVALVLLGAALGAALFQAPADAVTCTVTWTGAAGDGRWETPGNWSAGVLPGSGDWACIPASAGQVTVANGVRVVRGLTAESTAGFRISGGSLRLTDTAEASSIVNLVFTGGDLTVGPGARLDLLGRAEWLQGSFSEGGTTTVVAGATLDLPAAPGGAGNRDVQRGHTLRNEGTVNWTGGNIGCLRDGGRILNAGTFNVQADGGRIFPCAGNPAPLMQNLAAGRIVRSGTGTATIEVPFDNDGTIQVDSGSLRITGGSSSGQSDSGVMTVAAGGTLELAGGLRRFASPARAEGAGTLLITGGDVAGDLTILGNATWLGGGLSDAGTTTIAEGAILTIPAGATGDRELQRTHVLRNEGTVNWTGGDIGCLRDGGSFDNAGTFNIQAGAGRMFVCSGNPPPRLRNLPSGRIVKSGPGTTAIDGVPMDNDGIIRVDAGTLRILAGTIAGESETGTITIAAGAVVELAAGNRRFASPARSEGPGTLLFSGGTIRGDLTIAGNATWTGGTFTDAGTTTIAPGGTLTIPGGTTTPRNLQISHVLRNEGTLNWTGGNIDCLRDGARLENAGTFNVEADGGRLVHCPGNPAPQVRNLATGRIVRSGTGTATIEAPFVNEGTVRLVSGILRIQGNYSAPGGSTLEFVIGGPNPGTGFGQFQVSGSCTVGGTLAVTNAPGFEPTPGQAFTVVTCGSGRTGTFATVTGPYPVQYNPQDVTLNATSGPAVGIAPESLTFPSQPLGTTSAPQTVTVTNTGGAPLTVSSVTLDGPNAGDFTKSSDTCSGTTVAPGASCTVGVSFTPTAVGTRTAVLTISDNAVNSPRTVPLSGTGATAPTTTTTTTSTTTTTTSSTSSTTSTTTTSTTTTSTTTSSTTSTTATSTTSTSTTVPPDTDPPDDSPPDTGPPETPPDTSPPATTIPPPTATTTPPTTAAPPTSEPPPPIEPPPTTPTTPPAEPPPPPAEPPPPGDPAPEAAQAPPEPSPSPVAESGAPLLDLAAATGTGPVVPSQAAGTATAVPATTSTATTVAPPAPAPAPRPDPGAGSAAPAVPSPGPAPAAIAPPSLAVLSSVGEASGPPGVGLEVAGSGFPPECRTVYFFFDGTRIGSARPENGTVRKAGLSVPGGVDAGRYEVTSSCRSSGTPVIQRTVFDVVPSDAYRTALVTALPKPDHVEFDLRGLLASLAVAAAILFLIAFPGELFNTTLEEHYDEVRRWFGLGPKNLAAETGKSQILPFLAFLILGGILYSFINPAFRFDRSSLAAAVGLALAMGVVTLAFDVPSLAWIRRTHGEWGRLVILPGTLVVAAACVLLSRLTHFMPGYFYGLIAGLAFRRQVAEGTRGRVAAASSVLVLGLSVASWLALVPVSDAADQPDPGLGLLVLEAMLGGIFWCGLDSLVIGLLPLRFLQGSHVRAWSRMGWIVLFVLSQAAFVHILLRPGTGYVADTTRSPTAVVVGLFVAFALFSFAFWAYFRFRSPRPALVDSEASD